MARELLEKFRQNGIVVHLRDFSLDTGIPTVAALAYDPSTFPADSEIVFAAGTTTDPTKSLIRALTEVAQLAGDFHRRTSYRPTLPKYETLEEAAYLMAPGPVVPLDSLPNLSRPNLKDEIACAWTALSRLGLEVLVVNITHPALNLPAVYVLIPGTHFLDRTRNTNVIFHLAKTAALYAPPLEALAALAELNAAFPQRFDVHFFLGLALENQDRAGEALEHFRRALELNPPAHELPSIYVHLGTCQKDLGYLPRGRRGLHPGPGTGPKPQGGPPLPGLLLLQAGGLSAGGGVLREGHRTGPGLGHRLRQPGDQFTKAGPPQGGRVRAQTGPGTGPHPGLRGPGLG